MKFLKLSVFIFLLVCLLNACATGAGTSEGSTGTAGLSMQLKELSAGESYRTQDGYALEFTTFALAFSKITLESFTTSEAFTADFADEEVTDVVEVEDIPAGEYDEVTLTLGNIGAVLIIAEATSGSDTCTVRVELTSDETITVNPADTNVDVTAGEEAELLVEVDPNQIFGTIDLPDTCTGGTTVTISASQSVSLSESVMDNLIGSEAFSLGSTEGHAHDH